MSILGLKNEAKENEQIGKYPTPTVRNTRVSQYCYLRDSPIFMGVRDREIWYRTTGHPYVSHPAIPIRKRSDAWKHTSAGRYIGSDRKRTTFARDPGPDWFTSFGKLTANWAWKLIRKTNQWSGNEKRWSGTKKVGFRMTEVGVSLVTFDFSVP